MGICASDEKNILFLLNGIHSSSVLPTIMWSYFEFLLVYSDFPSFVWIILNFVSLQPDSPISAFLPSDWL